MQEQSQAPSLLSVREGLSAEEIGTHIAYTGVDIGAEDAWALYDGGSRDVVVALVDTGIDYTHADFNGKGTTAAFKSAKAKQLFQRYQQMEKDYRQQEEKLNSMRLRYATGNKQEKTILTPAILDLEKRILQMSGELDALEINVRNAEKTK